MERLYTVDEVAESFQIPKSTVTELCHREGWPHVRLGRAIRFTEEMVKQIISAHIVSKTPTESPMFPGQRAHRPKRMTSGLPGQTERG